MPMNLLVRCGAVVAALPIVVPAAFAQLPPVRGFPTDALPALATLERVIQQTPDTARLDHNLLVMSEEPHHMGSPGSKADAEYGLAQFQAMGLDAKIEQFQALMPYPLERHVELLAPEHYTAQLKEPVIPEDKDSGDKGQLPTYNAYSADGDVTGELVYVNYGVPEDYERLAQMGIDVTGKIVIAKYGMSWRGIKPKVAAEHGAIACLIYSDPKDDGYYVGDVYPKGPMRPPQGVQRGSVMDMPTYPGDPLTPGWGDVPGAKQLDRSQAKTLMPIPVQPLSYGDAEPLLRNLGGPLAPDDWKGALGITYHVGPGPAKVRVALKFDWQVRPLYDVIARIPGASTPDQWIIAGSHQDAWVNGAQDPLSTTVTILEAARSFAALLKTGWKPQRTIMFALWDGEEPGLLGSTEWAEYHAADLQRHAVAYINTDTYEKGWLGIEASHSLETFFREVARDAPAPDGKGALEDLTAHLLAEAHTAHDSARARDPHIGALGSGSDYTVFIDHLGVASANMGYGGDQDAGIYHSIYDSYDFFTRFLDPGFRFGVAQTAAVGIAVLRLADAPVLPFRFTDAANTYRRYVQQVDSLATRTLGAGALDLSAVRSAVEGLADAGRAFDAALDRVMADGAQALAAKRRVLGPANQDIYLAERALTDSVGLPRRPWFENMVYAPGFYTGYGVKTLPGIREAVEQKHLAEAQAEAAATAAAIDRMAAAVRKAVGDLGAL
jgi:N-acetylated-alpha-linked acidic dipeptidase